MRPVGAPPGQQVGRPQASDCSFGRPSAPPVKFSPSRSSSLFGQQIQFVAPPSSPPWPFVTLARRELGINRLPLGAQITGSSPLLSRVAKAEATRWVINDANLMISNKHSAPLEALGPPEMLSRGFELRPTTCCASIHPACPDAGLGNSLAGRLIGTGSRLIPAASCCSSSGPAGRKSAPTLD